MRTCNVDCWDCEGPKEHKINRVRCRECFNVWYDQTTVTIDDFYYDYGYDYDYDFTNEQEVDE